MGVLLLVGCATPTVHESSRTTILHPDQEDDIGGTFLESSDIRTIAQQMTAAILSAPEVSSRTDVTRIALSPVRNNTRFLIDSDIFLKRLRIELNRVSEGRVRFFMQDNAQGVRRQMLLEQDDEEWEAIADELAAHLLENGPKPADGKPVRVAVGAVQNTNVTGMNARSFLSMIRSRLAERSEGSMVFVADPLSLRVQEAMEAGESTSDLGVEYLLSGEFLAEGLQVAEGRENVELRIKEKREVFGESYAKEDTQEETYRFERKQNPNVTKRFNCQLIEVSGGTVVCEKMASLEKKMISGIGEADYILTGEVSALSKSSQGAYKSDYVIVSFQLVCPQNNEVLWEDAYESKRASQVGTVYR
jgi:TolB-like protein